MTHRRLLKQKQSPRGVPGNFEKFTEKHLCQSLFLIRNWHFITENTLAQVLWCEFCEISKNTFFHRTPVFGLKTLKYGPEKISAFGHFSRSESLLIFLYWFHLFIFCM